MAFGGFDLEGSGEMPRISGARVLMDFMSSAWAGSLRIGMGPPPWQTAITGARVLELGVDMLAKEDTGAGQVGWNISLY